MIGDVCIGDLFNRSALQLSTVRVESLPIKVQRTSALHDYFVVAVGVNRMRLQGLLGRWALAVFSRLKVHTSLDLPFYAAANLPPNRRIQAGGSESA